ncbi:MAG: LysR substrate-binding domain-containing protein [Pseudomonadota bacterium]
MSTKRITLQQLRYFLAVAEELHFGRAADRLGMAQPPLSRQIKQVEAKVGAELFTRGRSSVTLTQAGERLAKRVGAILADLDDALLEVKRLGEGAEGRLRIGFVGSSTFGLLPNIVKSFRASHPGVHLSLSPMNNAGLHRALVRREIDAGLARPAIEDPEITSRRLVEEPLVMAAPDTDDLPAMVDLRSQPERTYILYPEWPRPSYADTVLAGLRAIGVEPRDPVHTMDLQTALSLVAIGEGSCIVPQSVADTPRGGVRFHALSPTLGTTELAVAHRLDEQGIHLHAFLRIAQQVARKPLG